MEGTFWGQGTTREYSLVMVAAPELGMLPAMSVERDGIYITREESGECLLLTYAYRCKAGNGRLDALATRILGVEVEGLTGELLLSLGFTREYGALPARPCGGGR
jgi:hypothetical protein